MKFNLSPKAFNLIIKFEIFSFIISLVGIILLYIHINFYIDKILYYISINVFKFTFSIINFYSPLFHNRKCFFKFFQTDFFISRDIYLSNIAQYSKYCLKYTKNTLNSIHSITLSSGFTPYFEYLLLAASKASFIGSLFLTTWGNCK